ncbi:MAG: methyltransferase domain-containing protein, partial [Alphaproteobacteria bacterium]
MPNDGPSLYESGEYLDSNPDWHMENSPWKAANIAAMIEREGVEFDRGVEVGCGAGLILQEMATRFLSKAWAGYDVSPDAETFWERWQGGKVSYNREDFLETTTPADLVMLIDVFEHVDDYLGFLKQLSKLGRSFIFHIPLDLNAQGLMRGSMLKSRDHVGHLHYFSKDTALATLNDSGYDVKAWQFTSSSQHAGRSHRPLRTRIAGGFQFEAQRYQANLI